MINEEHVELDKVVRILSYKPHPDEVVVNILDTPTIKRLIFPSFLQISETEQLQIANYDEYKHWHSHNAISNSRFVQSYLRGENGIFLSVTTHPEVSASPDIVNVKFGNKHLEEQIVTLELLKNLLAEIIPLFGSESATVYDSRIMSYYDGKVPTYLGPENKNYRSEIGWISYFGPKQIAFLGRERFDNLKTCFEKLDLFDGVLIVLQEEPYDANNPLHRMREAQALSELGLTPFAQQ